MNIHITWFV